MKKIGEIFFNARKEKNWSLGQLKIRLDAIAPQKKFSVSEINRIEKD